MAKNSLPDFFPVQGLVNMPALYNPRTQTNCVELNIRDRINYNPLWFLRVPERAAKLNIIPTIVLLDFFEFYPHIVKPYPANNHWHTFNTDQLNEALNQVWSHHHARIRASP